MSTILKNILIILLLLSSFSPLKAQEDEGEEANKGTSCGGVERWAQKVLIDADTTKINFTPVTSTVSSLVKISTPTPSTTMSRYIGVEDITYKVTCSIVIKKSEDDNDYHLVIVNGKDSMIAEIPDPLCSAAASSPYVNSYIAARNFIDANIASGNVYSVHIPTVTVTGVAFVDPPHGQTGKAPNNLELHPALDVHFNSTGVSNTQEILSVVVSPNPFSDYLNVKVQSRVSQLGICELEVYNTTATKVFEADLLVNNGSEISQNVILPQLPTGEYLYRILNNGHPVYYGKLIHDK